MYVRIHLTCVHSPLLFGKIIRIERIPVRAAILGCLGFICNEGVGIGVFLHSSKTYFFWVACKLRCFSANYNNTFCLESLYLEKDLPPSCQHDTDIIYLDLHVQNQLFKNLHTRGKIQVYMKHHPTLGPGSVVGEKGKKRAQIRKISANEATWAVASAECLSTRFVRRLFFSSTTFSNTSAIS